MGEESKKMTALTFLSRQSLEEGGSRLAVSSRRSFSEDGSFSAGGCSMRITEDVRRYAAEKGLTDDAAIERGLEEKAKEFQEAEQKFIPNHEPH